MNPAVRVLIVDGSDDFAAMLADVMRTESIFNLVGVAQDGKEALRLIEKQKPELIVMDTMLKELDGLSVIRFISGLPLPWVPAVFLTPSFMTDEMCLEAKTLGVNYIMSKPVHLESMMERLRQFYSAGVFSLLKKSEERPSLYLRRKITDMLLRNRISPNIIGFEVLREGIMAVAVNRELMRGVTKVLYPQLAKQFNSTAARIERNIRTAVENGWKHSPASVKCEFFGYDDEEPPKNTVFIATLADRATLGGTELSGIEEKSLLL